MSSEAHSNIAIAGMKPKAFLPRAKDADGNAADADIINSDPFNVRP
jgi:hypothetical protein